MNKTFSDETIQECEASVLLRVAREGMFEPGLYPAGMGNVTREIAPAVETPVVQTDESSKLVVKKISIWDEPEDR